MCTKISRFRIIYLKTLFFKFFDTKIMSWPPLNHTFLSSCEHVLTPQTLFIHILNQNFWSFTTTGFLGLLGTILFLPYYLLFFYFSCLIIFFSWLAFLDLLFLACFSCLIIYFSWLTSEVKGKHLCESLVHPLFGNVLMNSTFLTCCVSN